MIYIYVFFFRQQNRMEALQARYNSVNEAYESVARRFGEDPTKTPSGDFFTLLSVSS